MAEAKSQRKEIFSKLRGCCPLRFSQPQNCLPCSCESRVVLAFPPSLEGLAVAVDSAFFLSLPLLCLASIRTRIGLSSPGARRGSSFQAGRCDLQIDLRKSKSRSLGIGQFSAVARNAASAPLVPISVLHRFDSQAVEWFVDFSGHP